MRAVTRLATAGGLGLLLLLGGCGGGGGGGGDGTDEQPTNNLSASSQEVVSPDPRIGYPLKVSVSISAEEAADDVSVSLFAIDKELPREQTRQLPLGTQIIRRVEAGENSKPGRAPGAPAHRAIEEDPAARCRSARRSKVGPARRVAAATGSCGLVSPSSIEDQ